MITNAGQGVCENRVYVRTHTEALSRGQRRQTPNRGQTMGGKSRQGSKGFCHEKTVRKHVTLYMIKNNKNKCTLLVIYFHLVLFFLFIFFMRCFVWFPILIHIGIFRRQSTSAVFLIENIHLKEILSPYIFPLYFGHEVNNLVAHTFHLRCITL